MNSNSKISVLIPDGESHILLYVVNCLAQQKNISIHVMSNAKHNAMRYSKYVRSFSYYPKTETDIEWIENINKIIKAKSIDIVMPIFEIGIKALIKHGKRLTEEVKLTLLPSLSSFNSAINKGLLSNHLVENNIPNPNSVILESEEDINKVESLNFPIIIKPLEGFGGGQGIFVFSNKQEIKDYFNKNSFQYKTIVQEYIKGYDIDCSVLCNKGEILAYTIQKGNLPGHSVFAPQFGVTFLYDRNLYTVVEKLMKSLNWSGVAHIDMRYDKKDNQFKIIEINTRFWVSLEASLIAGVNFPYLYLLASNEISFDVPKYEHVSYLNLKGIVKRFKESKKNIFRFKYLLSYTPVQFLLKDPLPMIYKYISRTKNILVSKFSRSSNKV